ncbi:MAG TPA: methyltransferase domain-containing protein [Gaiellaceae bacterium]|nr:methyltransferase domain-containing protein [Gaiellaceae bacterium]
MSGDEHAFTAVDDQPDPRAWIEVLDRMRQEPAYEAYKRSLVELLQPVAGGSYLEVGTGTGDDAITLASRFGVEVVGVDSSETMIQEARRRGLREARVADAHALPFADATFDGSWADRTFQHLSDPEAALAELVRVTKPGGRIVTADPDYDTQVVDVADQELARRVLRFRADHALRNGTLAHRMGRLFVRAGLGDVFVEGAAVVLRDPAALDNAMGLRTWAETACERGVLDVKDSSAWTQALDDAVAGGHFLYGFTVFLTAGTRP